MIGQTLGKARGSRSWRGSHPFMKNRRTCGADRGGKRGQAYVRAAGALFTKKGVEKLVYAHFSEIYDRMERMNVYFSRTS
jgi:hypothetical protein